MKHAIRPAALLSNRCLPADKTKPVCHQAESVPPIRLQAVEYEQEQMKQRVSDPENVCTSNEMNGRQYDFAHRIFFG